MKAPAVTTMNSIEITDVPVKSTQGWQSPRSARLKALRAAASHEEPVSDTVDVEAQDAEVERLLTTSDVQISKMEPPAKSSVAETKAKLWGSGKTEKLVVPRKERSPVRIASQFVNVVADDESGRSAGGVGRAANFGSHNRIVAPISEAASASSVVQQESLRLNKFGSPNALSKKAPQNGAMSPQPPHQKIIRGRPDVCTPHGPVPPQRAGGRGSHEHDDDDVLNRVLPPKRETTLPWVNRAQPDEYDQRDIAHSPTQSKAAVGDAVIAEGGLDTSFGEAIIAERGFETSLGVDVVPTQNKEFLAAPNEGNPKLAHSSPFQTELSAIATSLPPRPASRYIGATSSPHGSTDSAEPPPVELTGHLRSPSLGDFQVSINPATPASVEAAEIENGSPPRISSRSVDLEPPLSPTLRPTSMPKWDSPAQECPPASPPRRPSPSKIPRFGAVTLQRRVAAGFVETIDCPPSDEVEPTRADDGDRTGPMEEVEPTPTDTAPIETRSQTPPLSPRPKKERPWKEAANIFTTVPWQKGNLALSEDDALPRSCESNEVESGGEEKKSNDEFPGYANSTSSLMRMAVDSSHAVDYDHLAVQQFPRRTLSEEDDESLLSGGAIGSAIPAVVPPEFEKAVSDAPQRLDKPVFGDPTSFGAAGDEEAKAPPLSVADRAKALASWNGGLGTTPTAINGQVPQGAQIPRALSPIRHATSDTEGEGMSPTFAKRGYAIEDWKRTTSVDTKVDLDASSDFWQTANADTINDDNDWSKCDPDLGDTDSEAMAQDFKPPTPTRTKLGKPKSDTLPRSTKNRRKQSLEPQAPPTSSVASDKKPLPVHPKPVVASSRKIPTKNAVFDPFADSYGDKIEFTEATEFSEGTEFFASSTDPFSLEPVAFAPPEQFAPQPSEESYYHSNNDRVDDDSSAPNLAPPSGSGSLSHYELWSYDADTSTFHEGAAEI